MAWPISARFESVTALVTTIKAALLNAIQDAIFALYGGTKSVKSLLADGTGDVATAQTSGQVKGNTVAVATGISGTTVPTTTAVLGTMYKDLVPLGLGTFSIGGAAVTLVRGTGIKAKVYNGVGDYTITFTSAPANPTHATVLVTCTDTGGGSISSQVFACTAEAVTGNLKVQVKMYNAAPAAVDCGFGMVAWCS